MSGFLILQPAAVLALLTLTVLLMLPIRVFKAQFAKKVSLQDDFKYGVSADAPAEISVLNRNYINLLEAPILFYVASLLIFVTHKADTTFLYLAWTYVGLRILHSTIHLTYNRVLHRGLIFGASVSVLAVIWVRILLALW